MPGPAPKRNPRRTNARPDWRKLPRAGRSGKAPKNPMVAKPSPQLKQLWDDLWSTPQAAAWEDLGWTRVVARYAKVLLEAERADAPAALLAEVRQIEDRLGLSPMAMKRLMWEVDGAATAQAKSADVVVMDDYRNL